MTVAPAPFQKHWKPFLDKYQHPIESAAGGVIRGTITETLTHPLLTMKIRRQCGDRDVLIIALEILQKEGTKAFYKGFSAKLLEGNLKQVLVWPIITGVPEALKEHHLGKVPEQCITGMCAATADTFLSPIARTRVRALSGRAEHFSWKDVCGNAGKGVGTHWTNASVNWCTFLVSQKCLRDLHRKSPDQKLSLAELSLIGAQTALIVAVVAAPFDTANTMKQALDAGAKDLFSMSFRRLYRGSALNVAILTIKAATSVILIDILEQNPIPK